MTKKKSSGICAVKMEIFSEKNVIQKSWSAKNFSVPPNSAPGLRHCLQEVEELKQCDLYSDLQQPIYRCLTGTEAEGQDPESQACR